MKKAALVLAALFAALLLSHVPPAAAGSSQIFTVDTFQSYTDTLDLLGAWSTFEAPDPELVPNDGAGGGSPKQAMALLAGRFTEVAVPNGPLIAAPLPGTITDKSFAVTDLSQYQFLTIWVKKGAESLPGDALNVGLLVASQQAAVHLDTLSNVGTLSGWTRWDIDISGVTRTAVTGLRFNTDAQENPNADQNTEQLAVEIVLVDDITFNNGAVWQGDTGTGGSPGPWETYENWNTGTPAAGTTVQIPSTPDNAANWPQLNQNATVAELAVKGGAELYVDNHNLSVSGTLSNFGLIRQIKDINSYSTPYSFVNTGGYGGVTIADYGGCLANQQDSAACLASAASTLGSTAVSISGTACPGALNGLLRCFEISPSGGAPGGVEVTFYFSAADLNGNLCADLKPFHFNSGTGLWEPLLSYDLNCAPALKSMTVTNVTDFSPFTLAGESPTAVSLAQVGAAAPAPALAPALLLGLLLLALSAAFVWRGRK